MKKFCRLYFLIFTLFFVAGCDLQHLDMSKFTKLEKLAPVVFLPISSGDYVVKNFTSIPETGNVPVNYPEISFAPIVYDLSNLAYNFNAVDNVFVVVKTINACPMQLQYTISFDGVVLNSEVLAGGTLDAAGHVATSTEETREFLLSNSDFKKLNQAANLTLYIILTHPITGPVIANDLQNGKISVKIAYRASVNLLKL